MTLSRFVLMPKGESNPPCLQMPFALPPSYENQRRHMLGTTLQCEGAGEG